MAVEIKVPAVGESINEVTLTKWLKKDGEWVDRDEVIAELESEKATFEINAEQAGILHTVAKEDEDLQIGDVVATIDDKAEKPTVAGAMANTKNESIETKAASAVPSSTPEKVASKESKPNREEDKNQASPAGIIQIKVPVIGESIKDVTLTKWIKKDGEWVERDEVIAELESEKASFEINAEQAGVLHTLAKEDEEIEIGDVVATIDTGGKKPAGQNEAKGAGDEKAKPKEEETAQKSRSDHFPAEKITPEENQPRKREDIKTTPVAAAILAEKKIDPSKISATGFHGKITKNDVLSALENPGRAVGKELFSRTETPKKMSNLRRTISRRLVEAKNNTAMLTTFNEADMSAIMDLRAKYKETFKKTHDVNLGFMSFFTKACCFALQEWPSVNARMEGDNLIYHDFCDISIAVSSPKGLVVPVIRNAESLSMAEIEKEVVDLATKARESKLTIEEMTGGTFTITNGGVFGSMMSTPIINIPQSAILGMHNIIQRPVAINGQVVIRPMMYLALSYDHRVIDGRESVSFLVRIKQMLENPEQLLFGKDPVKALLQV
jgi:2-oxoglutarate dehydrogenase E2 component (dihydrolipoamide succinyltransferase)